MSGTEKIYEFDVAMSCSGCSGAVERVLKKMDGVNEYKTNLETQKVHVKTSLPYDAVYEKVNKAKPISDGREVDTY